MLFKMHRYKSILLSGLLLLCVRPAFGEVIDKILAVVNEKFIITLSDVRKEKGLQLALGGPDLGNDDEVTSALVEKYLMEEQMAQYPPIDIPEKDIEERLREIRDSRGFSPQELRQAVISKSRRAEFLTQRFAPFIRVTDEELRAHYNDVYVPEVRQQGLTVPSFEQATDTVRLRVTVLKIPDELDSWIADLKRRAKVEKVSK